MTRPPPSSTLFPYTTLFRSVLGVLGEDTPEHMIARLRQQATAYEADGRPVQPALHLIATVAQAAAGDDGMYRMRMRSEEHTSELQSHSDLVCRLLLEKKKTK